MIKEKVKTMSVGVIDERLEEQMQLGRRRKKRRMRRRKRRRRRRQRRRWRRGRTESTYQRRVHFEGKNVSKNIEEKKD